MHDRRGQPVHRRHLLRRPRRGALPTDRRGGRGRVQLHGLRGRLGGSQLRDTVRHPMRQCVTGPRSLNFHGSLPRRLLLLLLLAQALTDRNPRAQSTTATTIRCTGTIPPSMAPSAARVSQGSHTMAAIACAAPLRTSTTTTSISVRAADVLEPRPGSCRAIATAAAADEMPAVCASHGQRATEPCRAPISAGAARLEATKRPSNPQAPISPSRSSREHLCLLPLPPPRPLSRCKRTICGTPTPTAGSRATNRRARAQPSAAPLGPAAGTALGRAHAATATSETQAVATNAYSRHLSGRHRRRRFHHRHRFHHRRRRRRRRLRRWLRRASATT